MKLIAETAWHHEGQLDFFKNLIKEILASKADIIKLHITTNLDEYMTKDHPAYSILEKFMISPSSWEEILKSIHSSNKEMMLLFNDKGSIDLGMKYSPQYAEIHSVCLSDYHLLKYLGETINNESTKVVLGVGGNTLEQIENAIDLIGLDNVILMFGFQNYPTKYTDVNFGKMRKIMNMYPKYEFGYADHTAWDHEHNEMITMFGASLGMDYIEKHVTTSLGVQRTDFSAAIDVDKFNSIKSYMEILDECNGSGGLELNTGELEYSKPGQMRKIPILSKNIKKYETIGWSDIEFVRSSQPSSMDYMNLKQLINKPVNNDLEKGHVLSNKDFN